MYILSSLFAPTPLSAGANPAVEPDRQASADGLEDLHQDDQHHHRDLSLIHIFIRTLEDNLRAYREVIESGDTQALAAKLAWSADRKRHMNLE